MTTNGPIPMSDERQLRTVKLPFECGDTVYYRGRTERVPGTVIGFVVIGRSIRTLVRWTNDMDQIEHEFFELTTEYIPSFET